MFFSMTFTVNRFLYFERNRAIFTFISVCKIMQKVLINGSAQIKLLVINIAHLSFIPRSNTVERENQPLKQTSGEVTLHDGVHPTHSKQKLYSGTRSRKWNQFI